MGGREPMGMNYLQAVILKCLQKINGERTIYSIYHLLAGKKSSQTIQDAHLYQMTVYFKTAPQLKRSSFNDQIDYLLSNHYVVFQHDSQKCFVTDEGNEQLKYFFNESINLSYLNGWKYQDTAVSFWKRLTLLVQVASHITNNENRYYPIQKDPEVLEWTRTYLRNVKRKKTELSKKLYEELYAVLSGEFPDHPHIVVMRLSGYGLIGYTQKQTAEKLGIEQIEYHFRFMNGLHYLIQTITRNPNGFPILFPLLADIFQPLPYTKSTMRTYELLQSNYTIEQIAAMRQLRRSTIEDHIIEIALTDDLFSIDHFIDHEAAIDIFTTAQQLGQKKLKPIKERFEDVSYFQIRLVLAKMGEKL